MRFEGGGVKHRSGKITTGVHCPDAFIKKNVHYVKDCLPNPRNFLLFEKSVAFFFVYGGHMALHLAYQCMFFQEGV